jgi:hypothetical protein
MSERKGKKKTDNPMEPLCRELTVRKHTTSVEAEKENKYVVNLSNGVKDLNMDNRMSLTITSASEEVFLQFPVKSKLDLRLNASSQTRLDTHTEEEAEEKEEE